MLRAVEEQTQQERMADMDAARSHHREADSGEQAGTYYESDYRTPYDESEPHTATR
jgi:hypothetical protein